MHDQDNSKEQLIAENEELRRRLASLDAADLEHEETLGALRESEGRYRALAESACDIIYVLDRQGSLLYANRAAAQRDRHCRRPTRRQEANGAFPARHGAKTP